MKLYHGTNTDIEHIDFAISKAGKDFGVGFYLTPDLNLQSVKPNAVPTLKVELR